MNKERKIVVTLDAETYKDAISTAKAERETQSSWVRRLIVNALKKGKK